MSFEISAEKKEGKGQLKRRWQNCFCGEFWTKWRNFKKQKFTTKFTTNPKIFFMNIRIHSIYSIIEKKLIIIRWFKQQNQILPKPKTSLSNKPSPSNEPFLNRIGTKSYVSMQMQKHFGFVTVIWYAHSASKTCRTETCWILVNWKIDFLAI